MIRHTGNWQRLWDDRLLEYLDEHDTGTAVEVSKALPEQIPEFVLRDRLRTLAQAGYVEPGPNYDNYELTIWGQRYLEGRVRADCLYPEPTPARPGYVLR